MAYRIYVDEEVRKTLEEPGFPLPGHVIDKLNTAINRLAESPMTLSGPPSEYPLSMLHVEGLEFVPGARCFLCKVFEEPYKYEFYLNLRCDRIPVTDADQRTTVTQSASQSPRPAGARVSRGWASSPGQAHETAAPAG